MTWIKLHIILSLISYAAFLWSCVVGALYLVLERQLKAKVLGVWFHRLPSLESLETANYRGIAIGCALFTIGLACGLYGLYLQTGRWWTGDFKEYLSWGTWLAYCLLFWVRSSAALRGHKIALYSIAGFSLLVIAVFGVNYLVPTWHAYL